MKISSLAAIGAMSFALLARSALAGIVTVPPTLNPGAHYRLVFVTAGVLQATSSDISDYNAFVAAEAASVKVLLPPGTTWEAIVSTATSDAFDNIGGADPTPIYDLGGGIVANGTSELWSGSIHSPILLTLPDGVGYGGRVWTGTNTNGLAFNPLGSTVGGLVTEGNASFADSSWILVGSDSSFAFRPLYAISSDLVVPGAVPEPGSLGLLLVGSVLLLAVERNQ